MFELLVENSFYLFATLVCLYIYRIFTEDKLTSRTRSLSYPPTPPNPHWFWGHVFAIFDPKSKASSDLNFFRQVMELKSKMIMIKLPLISPYPRMILVGDPETAKHICLSKDFPKSPTYGDLIPFIGSQSIVIKEGKEWSGKRKLFNAGFDPTFLCKIVTVIVDKCNRLINVCRQDIKDGLVTNMHERAIIFTSDVIAQVVFGEDWGSDSNTLKISRDFVDVIGVQQKNPLKKYNIFFQLKLRQLKNLLDRDMINLVNKRTEKLHETRGEKDILSLALTDIHKSKQLKKDEKLKLTKTEMEDIISQLKTFYFAGHDTTASLISWAVWLVAQNPTVCEKLRAEAKRELGQQTFTNDQNNKMHYPTYQDLQRCTYIEAICKEALRLYPPAATARYNHDPNAEFNGCRIGQSILYVCSYVLHRHPDLWDQPEAFIPERFLDSENDPSFDYKYQPFSRGPRDCIGKYFAMAEAKIAIAAIFINFDAVVENKNEIYTHVLTTRPLDGAKVKFSLVAQD